MASRFPPRLSIVLAIIAFAVAAIPAFGIVMKDDAVGRAIVTAVWILIGLAWLGHLMRKR